MAILNDTIVNGDLSVAGALNGENKYTTLVWDTQVTLTELPGIAVTAKLPPNPNTDYQVQTKPIASGGGGVVYYVGSRETGDHTAYLNKLTSIYGAYGGAFTATSFNATSDRRLKENLEPLCPEKSILDLPIYKYDFINGLKGQIGCMAQDLKEICPQIVKEGTDGYLCIQESKIVYLLLKELQVLRDEVNDLKSQINSYKKEI